jgi:hypothetical protein
MSRSTGGCGVSPCCSLMQLDRVGRRRMIGGLSMNAKVVGCWVYCLGDRPVWPGHRCPGIRQTGFSGHRRFFTLPSITAHGGRAPIARLPIRGHWMSCCLPRAMLWSDM